jgi:hypothetical protein
MSNLLVNGDRRLKDLLTRLVANEQVTLQASFNNQQLSFPCNWSKTSSTPCTCNWAHRTSTKTAPCCPWRLSLGNRRVLDDHHQASDLWVRDISFKGVLVEVHGRARHRRISSCTSPPRTSRRSACTACCAGIGPRLAAYDLSHAGRRDRAPAQYILQAHRQAHPGTRKRTSDRFSLVLRLLGALCAFRGKAAPTVIDDRA